MKRVYVSLLAVVLAVFAVAPMVSLAAQLKAVKQKPANFHATLTGSTVYSNLSGFEPDFDPIVRIVIIAHAHAKGLPELNLVLDAYIEQFQVDTQPVLPDLIDTNKELSTSLGGFFSGKAMVVGPSNQILFTGSMLAEALIKPVCMYATGKVAPPECQTETQHMLVDMTGQRPAKGGSFTLKSIFVGNHALRITSGSLWGTANIPASATKALSRGSGSMAHCQEPPSKPKTPAAKKQAAADRKCINQILKDFQVARPAMKGTAGTGKPSHGYCFRNQCTNAAATGSSSSGGGTGTGTTVQSSHPVWMAPLGAGLIGLAVILLGFYFWQTRRERRLARLQRGLPSTEHTGSSS